MIQSNDQKIILFWPLQNSWPRSATALTNMKTNMIKMCILKYPLIASKSSSWL